MISSAFSAAFFSASAFFYSSAAALSAAFFSSAILFSSAFYENCRSRLNPGGVMTTQSGVVMIQGEELTTTVRRLGEHFADAHAYIAAVPTYAGGFMGFGWASDNPALRQHDRDTIAARYSATNLATRYYNPDLHCGAFALPSYIAKRVEAGK